MAFYSYELLHQKGGKFGKIWMAATKTLKLTRREVAIIDIKQSCKDVLENMISGHEPDRARGKQQRLSLYLSTFLMYGIVRIYHKQCEYLLADARSIFVRFPVKTERTDGKTDVIDLKDSPRPYLVTNPEFEHQDLGTDRAFYLILAELDGQEQVIPAHPSQQNRPQHKCFGFSSDSQPGSSSDSQPGANRSRRSRSKSRRDKPDKEPAVPGSPTVASVEQITMRDPPPLLVDTPLSPIPVPKDMELPPMMGQDLDLTMGQTDEPALALKDLLPNVPASTPIGAVTPERRTRPSRQTAVESPSLQQAPQGVREKTPEPKQPQEEMAQPPPPPARAGDRSPDITRPVASPPRRRRQPRRSLALEPIEVQQPAPRRHRQRRQLKFIDRQTQIPKREIRTFLQSGKDTCEQFKVIEVQKKNIDCTDWLNVPGRREFRNRPLNLLWRRGARFRRGLNESEMPEQTPTESDSSGTDRARTEGADRARADGADRARADGADRARADGVDGARAAAAAEGSEVQRSSEEEMYTATRLPQLDTERPILEEAAQQEPRPAEESIEALRNISAATERLEISEIEVPPVEAARDGSASRILEPGELSLSDIQPPEEGAKRSDTSGSRRGSRSRKSSEDPTEPQPSLSNTGLQTSGMGQGGLYNIVEEALEIPQLRPDEIADTGDREEELFSLLTEELSHQTSNKTTFRKLCPPEQATRKEAARMFTALLGLCTNRTVKAKQKTSFGEIYIRKI